MQVLKILSNLKHSLHTSNTIILLMSLLDHICKHTVYQYTVIWAGKIKSYKGFQTIKYSGYNLQTPVLVNQAIALAFPDEKQC